jgi:hypothetical protein
MRRVLPDNQPTICTLNFSHTPQFLFIRMSNTYDVVAGVNVCVAAESATVVGLASGDEVIVPSSAFFSSLAASLRVANIGRGSFDNQQIIIPRNAESLCSSCFSNCGPLSSISSENDSQLRRVESEALSYSALKSITIPRNVEILCPSCFSNCRSLSSISFENGSRLKH